MKKTATELETHRHSRRFNPGALPEKIVPLLLVVLLLILLAVFVIVALSLVGIFPAT